RRGWGFPARLLQYYLNKSAGPKKTAFVPNQDDINEVKKESYSLIRSVINDQLLQLRGKIVVGTKLPGFDDRVRWVSSNPLIGIPDALSSDGRYKDTNEYMFTTYAGATLKLSGTVTKITQTGPGFDRLTVYEVTATITLSDV